MSVYDDIKRERAQQDARWGQQNHPDGTNKEWKSMARLRRNECDHAFRNKAGTWRHILREEVYEAFAETDPARLREELVQVAAVAVQWVEAIDRRRGDR